ncbi:hypothetical protein [Streptomyces orinoci]|uniref:Uncharacterized protein n=1 Tax=Streptomyces orinoci TaxID=67339 RepID=A0ABV3K2X1_STRON|nr:hypothetical protein [Streptomyces orinoci]
MPYWPGTAVPNLPPLDETPRPRKTLQERLKDAHPIVPHPMPGDAASTDEQARPDRDISGTTTSEATMTTSDPYVSQITLLKRDVVYDPRAEQSAVPLLVHYDGGNTHETLLILDPDQVMSLWFQLDQVINRRSAARESW